MRRRYKVENYYSPTETVLISVRNVTQESAEGTTASAGRTVVKDNLMACSWHSKVNYNPELYMISVGKKRFTWEMLKKTDCFVVNFMPIELVKQVLECGRCSGREVYDKFMQIRLAKGEALKINCPICLEALGLIECKKVQEIDLEDHTLFIGEVVKIVNEKTHRRRPYETQKGNFISV